MELSTALKHRRLNALTPYNTEALEAALQEAGIFEKYKHVPKGIREGFQLDFPIITRTQTPPNSTTAMEFGEVVQGIVMAEVAKGRYIGPFTQKELEDLIGPFQTLPLSVIPKSDWPDKH
jgi:hypothetical protein